MKMKKKKNTDNIVIWIFIFILSVLATVTMFDYINLNNPTTQATAVFIAKMILTAVFILLLFLDSIQQELYDIKNSLDDLYDLKQISALRSTVNRRHLEKLLNDICALEEKQNEESSN